MNKNILYIQSNSEIAASFSEKFAEREIEFLVAPTAAAALQIMEEREIALLLIDINIPDMRLRELVEVCTKNFPGVILNVCIDIVTPLLVTKLVNRHHIHKVFMAPWDVNEMIDEIEESVECAQIEMDQKLQENMIYTEKEEFQRTLDSLTSALKKQRYSYSKLNTITQILLAQLKSLGDDSDLPAFVNSIFQTMLKMQTTGVTDIDGFEALVRLDLDKITKEAPGFRAGEISSCLIGSIPKVKAANIRFCLWLLAQYFAAVMDKCTMTVSSSFITATKAEFTVQAEGTVAVKLPEPVEQLIQELLRTFSVETGQEKQENGILYRLQFLTGFTDRSNHTDTALFKRRENDGFSGI